MDFSVTNCKTLAVFTARITCTRYLMLSKKNRAYLCTGNYDHKWGFHESVYGINVLQSTRIKNIAVASILMYSFYCRVQSTGKF